MEPASDELIAAIKAGLEGVTPGPWQVCRHLRSIEDDNSCPCGYRGGVWSRSSDLLLFEMGNCPNHPGADMMPIADRPAQIADANHIARCSPDNIAALLARLEQAEAERDRLREAVLQELVSEAQSMGLYDATPALKDRP